MKKLQHTFYTIFILIALMACTQKSDKNEIEQMIKQYYSSIATGEFDEAGQFLYLGNPEATKTELFMYHVINKEMQKRGGYKSIDVIDIDYINDSNEAKVLAVVHMGNEDKNENIKLIKENNTWKIKP